jgi:hypothetical protein
MATTQTEFKDAIVEIWDAAENADGSRAGMGEALDSIQELCSNVVPNVEELASPDSDDGDEEIDEG